MTKITLTQLISTHTGVDKAKVGRVLTALGELLPPALKNGETIFIRGFGTIKPIIRKEKKARNITAGTNMVIPEHRAPVMRFCSAFKEDVR